MEEVGRMVCPGCGEELGFRDEVFTFGLGDVVAGCSQCLHPHGAMEWFAEELELPLCV